jgi:hypothetical protein
MMPQNRNAWLVAITVALSCAWAYAGPEPRADRHGSGTDEVKLVLQREQHAPIDRRAELQSALKRQPDLAAARWQSGYVAASGVWRSYGDSPDGALLTKLESYRTRRAAARNTVRDQLTVAGWCKREGLRDQERAHRRVALNFASPAEQPEILDSLGYRRVGDQWLSPQDIEDWRRYSRAAEDSLKVWGNRVERLAAQLQESPRQREMARAALLEIRDPAAIPALESRLAGRDVAESLLLIKVLTSMPAYEASLALARLAVFSEWAETRKSATAALVGRKLEDFVPPLISLVSVPTESRVYLAPMRGQLLYTYFTVRENHQQIRASSTTFLPAPRVNIVIRQPTNGPLTVFGAVGDMYEQFANQLAANDSSRFAAEQIHARERLRASENEAVQDLNSRVSGVLSQVSGCERYTDPRQLWNWWADEADIRSGDKQVVVEDFVQQPAAQVDITVIAGHSCFQAGTPVWTETGPVPIDQIRIGDRVLSQNAETGELAYKPVLHKSLGPARELLRVTAGDETLVCTDGHRFWVAGEAWIKARELTPKTLLHTATASVPVESVSEGPKDQTHNLVVADFHSYFVGQQAFLVQDLPLPRSTNCVVPGLQPEW